MQSTSASLAPKKQRKETMEAKDIIKKAAIALIPSFILAGGAYFLIALTQGMQGINSMQPAVNWVCFLASETILVFVGQGQLIISRSLKYLAYECWLSPVFAIIYTFASASSVSSNAASAVGVGIGGFIIVVIALIGGGLLGLVLFSDFFRWCTCRKYVSAQSTAPPRFLRAGVACS
jgi:hypothetical protein